MPCTTDSPATNGIPILTRDAPVRRAMVKTRGMSSTKPTWKNTGMPTMNATTMSAQCTRRSPNRAMSVVAIRAAPPDSAIILPKIVPNPTTTAIDPNVAPTPS